MGMSSSSDCIVEHRSAVKNPITTHSRYLYDILVAARLMHEFRTATSDSCIIESNLINTCTPRGKV